MQQIRGLNTYIIETFQQIFQKHGIRAACQENKLRFPDFPALWVNGDAFYDESIVQLDLRLGGFDGERVLLESTIGYGQSIEERFQAAMRAMVNDSVHVLLAAFFQVPECHGVQKHCWQNASNHDVYLGLLTTVFGFPPDNQDGLNASTLLPKLVEQLRKQSFAPGTHWVRIQHLQSKGESLCNDVLLDNERWLEMQQFMSGLDWPYSESYYDIRLFVVLTDRETKGEYLKRHAH